MIFMLPLKYVGTVYLTTNTNVKVVCRGKTDPTSETKRGKLSDKNVF